MFNVDIGRSVQFYGSLSTKRVQVFSLLAFFVKRELWKKSCKMAKVVAGAPSRGQRMGETALQRFAYDPALLLSITRQCFTSLNPIRIQFIYL